VRLADVGLVVVLVAVLAVEWVYPPDVAPSERLLLLQAVAGGLVVLLGVVRGAARPGLVGVAFGACMALVGARRCADGLSGLGVLPPSPAWSAASGAVTCVALAGVLVLMLLGATSAGLRERPRSVR